MANGQLPIDSHWIGIRRIQLAAVAFCISIAYLAVLLGKTVKSLHASLPKIRPKTRLNIHEDF